MPQGNNDGHLVKQSPRAHGRAGFRSRPVCHAGRVDAYRQMWCGLALSVLLPEKRTGDVVMRENESLMYRTALQHSVYRFHKWWNPAYSLPLAAGRMRRTAGRLLRTHAPELFDTIKSRHNKSA
ncbi:hypothetical protein KsCSTR_34490 [Candidatus Kuenenia stuttgartiensis]|uniref:Uncharacterized protein n=1 Tax=Kuenenia stuttgartiensis TaxID=174633 RepID=Q1Q453_KUEST|nr:hypothetical protein KsCSTR_34490 [Candidatus Kuenenia stuttgartiensis]CAJ74795.1 unknown protein [Candidatus Kuenenia stuttgartiensis]